MNIPQNFWKTLMGFVGILILLAVVFVIKELKSIQYVGTGIQPTNTVSVDGTGNAYAVPDVATFTFTISDTEKAVAGAQTNATAKINAALKVVTAAGVASKDVQTESYSIEPQYQYQNAVCPLSGTVNESGGSVSSGVMIPAPISYCPPGKQTLTGYMVSESVSVKLRDLTKAGALLTSLGSADVSDLNGPSFDVDNPDAVQAQARSKAIADAQSKAQELAKELGVSLVRIVSFSDDSGSSIRPVMYAMNASVGAAAPAAAPAIPTGQQEVTDNVTVTYEIQ